MVIRCTHRARFTLAKRRQQPEYIKYHRQVNESPHHDNQIKDHVITGCGIDCSGKTLAGRFHKKRRQNNAPDRKGQTGIANCIDKATGQDETNDSGWQIRYQGRLKPARTVV